MVFAVESEIKNIPCPKGLFKRVLSVSELFNVSVLFHEFSPDSLRTSLFFGLLM